MYSGQHISQDFQTVYNVDCPWGSHDRHANAATLSDRTSKLITLPFDQVGGQWKLRNEALHSTAATVPNTHSSTEHYYVPKLLDSTPTLKLC
jgi:hypothetical protein